MRRVIKVGGSLLGDPPRLRHVLACLAEGAEGACVIVPGGGPDADAVRAAQIREGFSDAEAHRRALDAMGRTAERFRAIERRLVLSYAPWEIRSAAENGAGFPSPRLPGDAQRDPAVSVGRAGEAGAAVRRCDGEASFGAPPHPRLPPCSGDDEVAEALSPQAGRGARAAPRENFDGATALVWDPALLREGHPDIPETWDVTSDSLALWLATRMDAPACILVKSADAPADAGPEDLARSGLCDAAFPAFARCYGGTIAIRGPAGPAPVLTRRAA